MENLFSAFHKMFAFGLTSVGAMFSSVLPMHTHHQIPVITQVVSPAIVTSTPTTAPALLTIHKTVSEMGKNVTIFFAMPKSGGAINGGISGDCQGTIDGSYTGQPQYTMNGKGEITCNFGLLSLPANISFTGTIHPDQHEADINYRIAGGNYSKEGMVTVPYTE